jgi:DNA-binding NarL/FixJ family response regulator
MRFLLIADDSQTKIDLMVSMLGHFHWRGDAIIAMTTEQAEELMWEDVGFAFVDYYIPSKNGPALITQLREINPNIRIALVSSSDAPENFDEARKAGAEACICTSWQSDKVEKAFEEIIDDWMGRVVSS